MSSGFDLSDVATYGQTPIVNNFGLYAKKPIFSAQFLKNRENERLHKAFSILYGDDQLLVNHDRCAFYRPTKGISFETQSVDKPEWKTNYVYPGLHLDFHPSSYVKYDEMVKKRENFNYSATDDFVAENNLYCRADGLQIQGIINLLDNREEDGGYQCVPGFCHQYETWSNEKKTLRDQYVEGVYHFSKADKIDMKYVSDPIRIPVPKGTVILWSQLMAHGTKPNNSNRPCCIQFIKMFPKKIFSKERLKCRSSALKKIFKQNKFVPSKTGRVVFGV